MSSLRHEVSPATSTPNCFRAPNSFWLTYLALKSIEYATILDAQTYMFVYLNKHVVLERWLCFLVPNICFPPAPTMVPHVP